jgi:hypothetical protein
MSDADVADLAALGSGDGLVRVVAVVCIAALLTPPRTTSRRAR